MAAPPTTTHERSRTSRATGARLLVVDDDDAIRSLYVTLLEEVHGVGAVVAAGDGAEAVRLAKSVQLDVAVLDLNMPHLDGVEAALRLAVLQPTLSIALQSTDPDGLRERARGLDFALFDKVDFDGLMAWLAAVVNGRRDGAKTDARQRDRRCSRCGYGIATEPPPVRCPMCNSTPAWRRDGRRAAYGRTG